MEARRRTGIQGTGVRLHLGGCAGVAQAKSIISIANELAATSSALAASRIEAQASALCWPAFGDTHRAAWLRVRTRPALCWRATVPAAPVHWGRWRGYWVPAEATRLQRWPTSRCPCHPPPPQLPCGRPAAVRPFHPIEGNECQGGEQEQNGNGAQTHTGLWRTNTTIGV